MLTVHHLGISQSERIVWLCEELGIPYELKIYDRDAATRLAPAAYKALHPAGTAPIITDGDLVLPESGAIIEYIIHKYGGGRLVLPPTHPDYAAYLFWFHYANASFMTAEMGTMLIKFLDEGGAHPFSQMMGARADTAYRLIEDRLGEATYFAGDEFTAADIIMLFPLTTMRAFIGRDISAYPNLRAYLQRIGERPAYQRAMAKGDPGMTPMLA
jgi:glutathione S-transferase